MQTLKPETKERIDAAAIDIFYEKGFRDASMREIAERAEMTVGNLYHYYKNKATLFDAIVEEVYTNSITFPVELHGVRQNGMHRYKEPVSTLVDEIANYIYPHRKIIHILCRGSRGTKYENNYSELVKRTVIEQFVEAFTQNTPYSEERIKLVALVSSDFYVSAVTKAIIECETVDELKFILRDVIDFHRHGLNGYFNGEIANEK